MVKNSTEKEILESLQDRESRRVTRAHYLLDQEATKASPQQPQNYPDAKKHQLVSFIKSGIRILGYVLIPFDILWAAGILVLSEAVGIIEELV